MDEVGVDAVSPCIRLRVLDDARATRRRRHMATGVAHIPSQGNLKRQRPSMLDALGEFRVPFEATVFWLGALMHPWPHADADNRKVILLIPGFIAGDVTLAPMANFCRWLGHRVVFGGIWSNSECPRETMRSEE